MCKNIKIPSARYAIALESPTTSVTSQILIWGPVDYRWPRISGQESFAKAMVSLSSLNSDHKLYESVV